MYVYVSGTITNGGKDTSRKGMLKWTLKAIGVGYTLLQKGFNPYIPHLDWLFGWHKRAKKTTWDQYLNWDLAWIRRCDCVYRIRGKSEGADLECRFAKRMRKPIFYSIKELVKYRIIKRGKKK